ncbi:thermonuclease family protein [Rhizobium ruizarguesonis]|uniref:thermonuclease family protein n=1 Tax=Rhizobium ruizarguesonis TaxID=2081791 RepID=UPI001031E3B7|nr:thermonuclease family protein [Rhizobium ruizarguesonis]TAV82405.1 thermonuclease family protein [Rhizobium ruizarguesonis]
MSVITGISRAVWLFVPLGIVFLATCPAAADIAQTAYQRCGTGPRVNCVVDGDTLWNNDVKIRIADIDTPEISQPHCAAEKALGERATVRLMDLVNAGSFDILAWKNRDKDRNGRKLRVLVRDGRSIGDILVSEGLARTWTGKREPWC